MLKQLLLLFLAFLLTANILAQEPEILEKIPVPDVIDTLFIDHDINNWSLRLITYYKDHRFQLKDDHNRLNYAPNNPGGIGVGFATKKLILDCGINLQLKDEEPTDRFDLRLSIMLEKHNFSYFLQSYQGFSLKNDIPYGNEFRYDIRSFSSGINYMYLFNVSKYSISAMKSGLSKQKRTAVSFGLGGFTFYNRMLADSSIVPPALQSDFNEEAMLTKIYGIGGGVQGGFSVVVPIFNKFFVSGSLTPGVGLSFKHAYTETDFYAPSQIFLSNTVMEGVIGFNDTHFYLNFSVRLSIYTTGLDFDNHLVYRTPQAKFAIGYKLGDKYK